MSVRRNRTGQTIYRIGYLSEKADGLRGELAVPSGGVYRVRCKSCEVPGRLAVDAVLLKTSKKPVYPWWKHVRSAGKKGSKKPRYSERIPGEWVKV